MWYLAEESQLPPESSKLPSLRPLTCRSVEPPDPIKACQILLTLLRVDILNIFIPPGFEECVVQKVQLDFPFDVFTQRVVIPPPYPFSLSSSLYGIWISSLSEPASCEGDLDPLYECQLAMVEGIIIKSL